MEKLGENFNTFKVMERDTLPILYHPEIHPSIMKEVVHNSHVFTYSLKGSKEVKGKVWYKRRECLVESREKEVVELRLVTNDSNDFIGYRKKKNGTDK